MDTPETVHPTKEVEPYGKEASDFARVQLAGKEVGLEFDVQERDKYGRLLAYVWLGDKLFNEMLVAEGYAQVATYPPNVKYADRFTAAQKTAREGGKGLWGMPPEQPKASTAVEPEPQPQQQGITVYVTNTGAKYHVGSCSSLRKSKIPISLQEAKERGYGSCKRCRPPQ